MLTIRSSENVKIIVFVGILMQSMISADNEKYAATIETVSTESQSNIIINTLAEIRTEAITTISTETGSESTTTEAPASLESNTTESRTQTESQSGTISESTERVNSEAARATNSPEEENAEYTMFIESTEATMNSSDETDSEPDLTSESFSNESGTKSLEKVDSIPSTSSGLLAISNDRSETTANSIASENLESDIITDTSAVENTESNSSSETSTNEEYDLESSETFVASSAPAISNAGSETTTQSPGVTIPKFQLSTESSKLLDADSNPYSHDSSITESQSESNSESRSETNENFLAISNAGSEINTISSAIINQEFQIITETSKAENAESSVTDNNGPDSSSKLPQNEESEFKSSEESSDDANSTSGTSSELPTISNDGSYTITQSPEVVISNLQASSEDPTAIDVIDSTPNSERPEGYTGNFLVISNAGSETTSKSSIITNQGSQTITETSETENAKSDLSLEASSNPNSEFEASAEYLPKANSTSETSSGSPIISDDGFKTTTQSPVLANTESSLAIHDDSNIKDIAETDSESEPNSEATARSTGNFPAISSNAGSPTTLQSSETAKMETVTDPSATGSSEFEINFPAEEDSTSGNSWKLPEISNTVSEMTRQPPALASLQFQTNSGETGNSESESNYESPMGTTVRFQFSLNTGSETNTKSAETVNLESQTITVTSAAGSSESDEAPPSEAVSASVNPIEFLAISNAVFEMTTQPPSLDSMKLQTNSRETENTESESELNFESLTENPVHSTVVSNTESETTTKSTAPVNSESQIITGNSESDITSRSEANSTSGNSLQLPEISNAIFEITTQPPTLASIKFETNSESGESELNSESLTEDTEYFPAISNDSATESGSDIKISTDYPATPKTAIYPTESNFGTKYNLYFSSEPASYQGAQSACEEMNMQLVTIEDKEKNDEIQKYLQQIGDTTKTFLSGAVRRGLDGRKAGNEPFRWENLHRLTFRNFIEGTPRNYPDIERTVIAVTNDGKELKWLDVKPTDNYYYICETPSSSDVPAPLEPENPYNFHFSDFIVDSYRAAASECAKLGMSLVTISNEVKNYALAKILEANDDSTRYLQMSFVKNNVLVWPNCDRVQWTNPSTDCFTKSTDLCESIHFDYATQNAGWCRDDCSKRRFLLCENITKSELSQNGAKKCKVRTGHGTAGV
ncbi:uncharacterized protein LOC130442728 [Diorhabda sublineata]|uniref:uncharacterized protein LOC130442728 n=1 Tax=Diorhabda sublineata TaxID=1163346 RepID=UPI0024E1192E|nr:uncharacterized protein LOC130442728 [Diorhabda sublineata]